MDYKEKLRLAKEALVSGSYDRETIEYIFPELREESEDEKIRKDITSFLRSKNGYMNPNEDWDFHNRWLPWLEKQGEVCHSIMWHSVFEEPEEMQELLCELESDDATWHEVAFYHAETKTFWNGERQVEDVIRWCYIGDLHKKSKFETSIQEGDNIVTNEDGTRFNINQLERVAKKENLAWSEEDDKMLDDAIGAVGAADYYYTYNDKEEIKHWLKSLKERMKGE